MNWLRILVRKIINIFNFPKHIKRYVLKRKVKKYQQIESKKGRNSLKAINISIVILGLLAIICFNMMYKNRDLLLGSILVVLIYLYFAVRTKGKGVRGKKSVINEIILKDEDNKIIKNWNINKATSLLIGKKTKSNAVDIDLSESIYATLISREHAVMNVVGSDWYIEDIGSSNGSGIKRKSDNKKFRIYEGTPHKIHPGDIIYIANTKLLVK